jgi:hypothetical protein
VTEQPRSVFEVVHKVWDNLRSRDTHLAVREIIGHLVLLEQAGSVAHDWQGETLFYRAA